MATAVGLAILTLNSALKHSRQKRNGLIEDALLTAGGIAVAACAMGATGS